MGAHGHETVQAWIERSYVQELDPNEISRLHRELEECEACRRYYDHLAELDRAITGRAVALAPVSVDRVWSAVETEVLKRPRRAPRWSAWLLATMATAAAAFLIAVPSPEFQTRGGQTRRAEFGLSAFLIDPDTKTVLRSEGEIKPVPAGHLVQLALTARRSVPLMIAGVDAQGELHWLHNQDDPATPYGATGEEVESPVGRAFEIRSEDSPISIWVIETSAEFDPTAALPALEARDPDLVLEVTR